METIAAYDREPVRGHFPVQPTMDEKAKKDVLSKLAKEADFTFTTNFLNLADKKRIGNVSSIIDELRTCTATPPTRRSRRSAARSSERAAVHDRQESEMTAQVHQAQARG